MVKKGHKEVAPCFLEIEKDLVRVRGRKSKTPLHYVSKVANQDFFLDRFLEACPDSILDVTTQNSTALHIAVENRRLDVLQVLLRTLMKTAYHREVVNRKDENGNTALHIAASSNEAQMLKLLLNCKADKHATDQAGLTALGVSQQHGYTESITGENRNALLVILGLMLLTATYQATLSPPGGVWQGGNASKKLGISVMDPSQTAVQVLLAFLAVCFHQSISFIVPTSSASIILSPLGDRFHLNGVHVYRISSVEIQCFDSGMLDFTISLLRYCSRTYSESPCSHHCSYE
ncbi:ankyrin repeat-containing protein BDA1-like [Hibiscus syriacus]|uniref:ankyrin repeat-containing protein BDA1-like n=1 Tax=Hibiscus syriacus TaxID=106335 RepID=UPI001923651C|nr:ankyrin repeat-containing protein BDA1-like [Hibiscus syriacus]